MIARFHRGERGQSLVEFALAVPLLAVTLLGGADMARAYAAQLAVQNGARAGAEESALDVTPTGADAIAAVQNEIGRTPGLTAANAAVTVTYTLVDGSSVCTGAADIQQAGTSALGAPCYVNVRVRYTFSTLIAWPGLPQSFALDRTTRVRRYQ